MNIALPALVVFLALLPGFIARSRIKRAERLSLDYSPFGQVATEAMVWAIVLHGLWLGLATLLSAFDDLIGAQPPAGRPPLDAGVVLHLLAAHGPTQAEAVDVVAQHAGRIAAYLASLILFSYAGPTLLRQAVTLLSTDGRALDYVALLDDLALWHKPWALEAQDRLRQRWARDFYRAESDEAPATDDRADAI